MKDISGKKFGRWLVIRIIEKRPNRDGGTRIFWECKCDCGNIRSIDAASLKSGHSKSCGCLRKEGHRTLPQGVSERNLLLYSYKRNAKKRNLCFSLSTEQFTELIQKECFYCGESPKNKLNGKWFAGEYFYNGIDRVNNDVGYVQENCVSCCETCNKAKRTMSVDEFYSWIDRVYEHKRPKQLLGLPIVYTDLVVGDGTSEWWHKLQIELDEQGISK